MKNKCKMKLMNILNLFYQNFIEALDKGIVDNTVF